jgi:hypothetical protein
MVVMIIAVAVAVAMDASAPSSRCAAQHGAKTVQAALLVIASALGHHLEMMFPPAATWTRAVGLRGQLKFIIK